MTTFLAILGVLYLATSCIALARDAWKRRRKPAPAPVDLPAGACSCRLCRLLFASSVCIDRGAAPAVGFRIDSLSADGVGSIALVVTSDVVFRDVVKPAVAARFPQSAWARDGGR